MMLWRSILPVSLLAMFGCVTVPDIQESHPINQPKTLLLGNDALWEMRTNIAKGSSP